MKTIWISWDAQEEYPAGGVTAEVGADGYWRARATGPCFDKGTVLGPCVRAGRHVLATHTRVEVRWKVLPPDRVPEPHVSRVGVYARIRRKGQPDMLIPAVLKVTADDAVVVAVQGQGFRKIPADIWHTNFIMDRLARDGRPTLRRA